MIIKRSTLCSSDDLPTLILGEGIFTSFQQEGDAIRGAAEEESARGSTWKQFTFVLTFFFFFSWNPRFEKWHRLLALLPKTGEGGGSRRAALRKGGRCPLNGLLQMALTHSRQDGWSVSGEPERANESPHVVTELLSQVHLE